MAEPSAVIWRWKDEESPRRFRVSPTSPIGQAIIVSLIAGILYWRGHTTPAAVVGTLACLVLVGGLAFPRGFDRFAVFMQAAGLKVGEFLSAILLVPVYFFLFTPIALWFRFRGKDPLNRQYPGVGETCWETRDVAAQKDADYTKQF